MSMTLLRAALFSCALCFSNLGHAQVVISQVYGGGGNNGATYKSDFVELHNNGDSAVDLSGWSVQYASSSGSSWQVTSLSGSVAAGGYYLVKQADGSGGSVDLPTADATGTISMSSSNGKVALLDSADALSGSCPTGYTDLVGYGSASCYEGSGATASLSNSTAALRADSGCTDSDNNSADFGTGDPSPRNSASTVSLCAGGGSIVLSGAEASVAEGDSGTTTLVFTLSLSEAAGSGGVSFDVATSDGTATAGSDYLALTASSLSIAEGETSTSIAVTVYGDADNEDDETLTLEISNVSGALPESLSITGTILNDDFNLIPIHTLQGDGDASPYEGQEIATSGIVTGRLSSGFFLQAPDAEADGSPLTSEGIYVYVGSTPPDEAAVGNKVTVQGTISEYVPSSDPNQPPLTEISGSPTVLVQSTGNALPAAIPLTPTLPDPAGDHNQLERLEGMRVTAASLTVNTPTDGSVTESSATSTGNGIFHAYVTGVPRPWREAGVQLPDTLPSGSPDNVPRWDTNPEVIAVNSAGMGGDSLDLASGCVITDVTGPLYYTYRRYTVYPEATPAVACGDHLQPQAVPEPGSDDVTVATYNMERFFDDTDDPDVGETVLTSTAYQMRLSKAGIGIVDYLNLPDILGAVEVENLDVLQAIADQVNTYAVAQGLPDPGYVAYLEEGNDVGGIDVGFLVKTADVTAGLPRVEVVSIAQEGKDTTWTEPDGDLDLLNDRPPLVLQAKVNFADGRQLPLTAIVVHQRSLNGAEDDDEGGVRVRAKRQTQAEFLANLLQARQQADPDEYVLVMGDFNAFEFNDGYVDAMGTVTGLPSADDTTVVDGDGADLVDPDYYDLTWLDTPDQSYSYTYDGNIQSLDHILASDALMHADQIVSMSLTHARLNADYPESARNDATTPTRLSDHDPTMVTLKLQQAQSADLGVAVTPASTEVGPGEDAVWTVDAQNLGPDAAAYAALAIAFDAVVTPTLTAAPGWDCIPSTSDTRTVLTCTTASMPAGTAQSFAVRVPATTALAGSSLTLAASITSQTPDPVTGNDGDNVAIAVVQPQQADLAVTIAGPASMSASTFSAQYTLTLSNLGSAAASNVVLHIEGNTLSTTSVLKAPSGWSCSRQSTTSTRIATFDCTASGVAAGASASFGLTVNARPTPSSGMITLQASASASSTDALPENNSASIQTTLE